MRIYLNRWFAKFARKEGLSEAALRDAVGRAERGLIDADLGGGLLKQRVAREGGGKSGGYRTLIFFRSGERAVFTFGFAKSGKANLSVDELAAFKKAAAIVLALSNEQMDVEVEAGRLSEVSYGDEDV